MTLGSSHKSVATTLVLAIANASISQFEYILSTVTMMQH